LKGELATSELASYLSMMGYLDDEIERLDFDDSGGVSLGHFLLKSCYLLSGYDSVLWKEEDSSQSEMISRLQSRKSQLVSPRHETNIGMVSKVSFGCSKFEAQNKIAAWDHTIYLILHETCYQSQFHRSKCAHYSSWSSKYAGVSIQRNDVQTAVARAATSKLPDAWGQVYVAVINAADLVTSPGSSVAVQVWLAKRNFAGEIQQLENTQGGRKEVSNHLRTSYVKKDDIRMHEFNEEMLFELPTNRLATSRTPTQSLVDAALQIDVLERVGDGMSRVIGELRLNLDEDQIFSALKDGQYIDKSFLLSAHNKTFYSTTHG
jgi:hypothetical protein